jgi:hypothetical protein
MDWEIKLLYNHKKHSTNSNMRACYFEALWHGSLWLKIKEEFNISALVDSGPLPLTDALRLTRKIFLIYSNMVDQDSKKFPTCHSPPWVVHLKTQELSSIILYHS